MTVEEKRKKLKEYCNNFDVPFCVGCPLEKERDAGAGGCYSGVSDKVLKKHYEMVFGPDRAPDNTCVSCGAEIPEGRQVCPDCEAKVNIGDDLDNPPENIERQVERVKELFRTNNTIKKAIGTDPIKPDYYNDTKFSPFDVIDDWGLNFYLGNAVKYIKRAGKKANNSRLQDLKKIREYIDHEIRVEESNDEIEEID